MKQLILSTLVVATLFAANTPAMARVIVRERVFVNNPGVVYYRPPMYRGRARVYGYPAYSRWRVPPRAYYANGYAPGQWVY